MMTVVSWSRERRWLRGIGFLLVYIAVIATLAFVLTLLHPGAPF